MKCPKCGHENPETDKFCNGCGVPFQSELVCPKCGKTNPKGSKFCNECGQVLTEQSLTPPPPTSSSPLPTSFAKGRYTVKKFLGEGGRKKVYLAHDTTLDRDVAFALIKTEKLDEAGRTRLQLAELLLEHYPKEKKEAPEHLEFAIKEFQEMKMKPSLERDLRQKTILKA